MGQRGPDLRLNSRSVDVCPTAVYHPDCVGLRVDDGLLPRIIHQRGRVVFPLQQSGLEGLDGGAWVTCLSDSAEYNACRIWDEEGRTLGPARYTLEDTRRAASTAELKYAYRIGEAIGLVGGLELLKVSPIGK